MQRYSIWLTLGIDWNGGMKQGMKGQTKAQIQGDFTQIYLYVWLNPLPIQNLYKIPIEILIYVRNQIKTVFFFLFSFLGVGVYYPMFVEKSDLITNWHGQNPFVYKYLMVMGLTSGKNNLGK
jgi:hypothetical protein